ncbi:MAG: hypothetical protein OXH08_06495 [Gammaproteobacteria bacterium]|nr:hypothetical protein [Gammaproteobacteria bacterium]MDE2716153.1 hypothetical protein [Chloroflexota bacterium]
MHQLVDGRSLCLDCIALEHVVTMGDTLGPGFLQESYHMVRDSVGNYWHGQYEEIKMFNADGAFLQTIGRAGEGPMEFSNAAPLYTDAEGRVHVIDSNNTRRTVIDRNFALSDEALLPGFVRQAAPLASGDLWVVNMWHTTPAAIGMPLHILEDDSLIASFHGVADVEAGAQSELTSWRILTVDSADRIFASPTDRYVVEVWDSAGRRLTGFAGPTLNELPRRPGGVTRTNPWRNSMRALHVDRSDRLWVVSWQRRADWLNAMEERVRANGDVSLAIKPDLDLSAVLDSHIDVIDLRSATVVARARMNELVIGFLDDETFWAGEYGPLGEPLISVWRLALDL